MSKEIAISLTKRERDLILKHGYPFDCIEEQLRASASSPADKEIRDDAYWWEQVVGNLSISVNEDLSSMAKAELAEEVSRLADYIEQECRNHPGC